MIRHLFIIVALVAFSTVAAGDDTQPRFTTIAVCIDSDSEPLAAWQIELTPENGGAEIVGIEGGDEPFGAPPHYDARAFRTGRVVLASFTTDPRPRRGVQHVATVHAMQTATNVTYSTILEAAGNEKGTRIVAQVWASRDDCKTRGAP